MSRIYYPRERTVASVQPPTADLLREVREIERRRVLLDVRDAIDRLQTRQPRHSAYDTEPREAAAFKADVLDALHRLEGEK